MNTLVLGGAASGKSAFAEQCACDAARVLGAPLVYVATLNADSGGDTAERIRRHRAARAGKGFATLEWADCRTVPDVRVAVAGRNGAEADGGALSRPVALIEDFGNLVANYLYPLNTPSAPDSASAALPAPASSSADAAVSALLSLLYKLAAQTCACVAVTNEIALCGTLPDGVRLYAQVLSQLNARWAWKSEQVYAVVAGIPVALSRR